MTRESRARAFVFADPASLRLAAEIERFAPSEATILIVGETGTGKELVARHVHELSRRHGKPFVAVNCAALPETLIESELFGHERGAFTSALEGKAGWFEAADGGTLFLDEIGDLPLVAQGVLLRALQEREIVRVGSRRARPVDFRLIAATNVDLEAAIGTGRFRNDLYYRVKVATLNIAPLRERRRDILPLAEHFLRGFAANDGAPVPGFSVEAAALLERYAWPGNIRELENAVQRAFLVHGEAEIEPADFQLPSSAPGEAAAPAEQPRSAELEAALATFLDGCAARAFDDVIDALVRVAYERSGRNQVQSAALLGISRNVLRARLARLGYIRGRS